MGGEMGRRLRSPELPEEAEGRLCFCRTKAVRACVSERPSGGRQDHAHTAITLSPGRTWH